MKKIISILMLFILAFSLIACSSPFDDDSMGEDEVEGKVTIRVGIRNDPYEKAMMNALKREFEKQNNPYFAWDILENAKEVAPDDPVLARALAHLAPEVSDYVKTLNRAQKAEKSGDYAAALNYFLAAQNIFPASQACRLGIERVAGKYMQ